MSKWLRLGLLLALSTSGVGAVDWKALKPRGYVSDFADVIDAAGKNQLEAYCQAVERATGGQIAVVVVPSLEGEPVEDVASTMYRGWGVGLRGKQDGVLLLLAVRDQRSRLEIGSGLRALLTGGFYDSVLREMRPALRERQYGEAMMAAAETIGQAMARARNATLSASLPRRIRPGTYEWMSWPVVIGGVLLLVWLMRAGGLRGYDGAGGGGFLPDLILGWPLARSALARGALARATWGSNGSGGFGGYDSGDGGFGGFGGGDSAGRAASDW